MDELHPTDLKEYEDRLAAILISLLQFGDSGVSAIQRAVTHLLQAS
jgi:hypothetical protein